MKNRFPERRNIALMLTGVVGMGICLSLLLKVGYGTDTSSFMNSSIAARTGITLGTVMVSMNAIQLIVQIIWGRRFIGIGTIVNMTVIGYIADFCTMLEESHLPSFLFSLQPYRSLTFAIALIFFLISAALYMNSETGLAPYDAIPTIISSAAHLPFFAVRIAWDLLAIAIGIASGGHLPLGTVILAFTIGPTVSWIGRAMRKEAPPSKAEHIASDDTHGRGKTAV